MHADKLERRWYLQEYRARKRAEAGLPPPRKKRKGPRPFVGVDGEGAGRNRYGQQHYMLLRIGDRELFTGRRLTTQQCLEWILNTPPEPLLVGYGFGYDATQILRDLPPERIARLFQPLEFGEGKSRYTRWNDYGIEYLPKNYLRICRLKRTRVERRDGTTAIVPLAVKGSARTIYETIGFFQTGFLSALKKWSIGPEHWSEIERNKAARDSFDRMTRAIRHYNKLECDLLAELMQRFRAVCLEANIKPRTWNGAGKIAAFLHHDHGTITGAEVNRRTPSGVLSLALAAYYGGRFEVTRTGEVAGPIFEYDINSAYPTAMRDLPCLWHGGWVRQNRAQLAKCRSLYVARVRFSHPASAKLCGLPIRQKDGKLFWPRHGEGVYWSTEIRSAERLGAKIEHIEGWRYNEQCRCRAFDWIDPLYAYRKQLADMRGEPIKLGLNSLYGKLAQRIGNPRYGNMIWAGLITATVRARLNDAAAERPAAVVMFATDALFTIRPLHLDCGEALGQWEAQQHERIFIVQPGLYWGAKRPKTRGIPSESFFRDHIPAFETAWRKWIAASFATGGAAGLPPEVRVPMKLFVGLRLAHSWGKPEAAGCWTFIGSDGLAQAKGEEPGKRFSFVWKGKRDMDGVLLQGGAAITRPCSGLDDTGRPMVSLPHKGNMALIEELDRLRRVYDEQPDHVDLSPP